MQQDEGKKENAVGADEKCDRVVYFGYLEIFVQADSGDSRGGNNTDTGSG